jgi:uncharacterized membrane protein YhhN
MWGWLAVGLSGFIYLSANERSPKKLVTLAKPLTLLLLLGILFSQPDLTAASLWIAAGLALALVAELGRSLITVNRHLLFVCMLLMFTCFSKSFWLQLSGALSWWLPALLFAAGVIVFFLMLPRLDSQVFPVTIMGLMMLQLCWAATELCLRESGVGHQLACASSYLFALSALAYALRGYQSRAPSRLASASYLLAHALMVASVTI